MALSQRTQFALATALFGVLSFLLGIFAEMKKVYMFIATTPLRCDAQMLSIFRSNVC